MNHFQALLCFLLVVTEAIAEEESHFAGCPEGWLQYGVSCYRYNATPATWDEGAATCVLHNAHLLFLEDTAEDVIVQGFMKKAANMTWFGLRRADLSDPSHLRHSVLATRLQTQWVWTPSTDFLGAKELGSLDVLQRLQSDPEEGAVPGGEDGVDGRARNCAAVLADSSLWSPRPCDTLLPFLCERAPGCETGYYGKSCSSQCHCYKGDHCDIRGSCPRGCQSGWTGSACHLVNPQPQAEYHCLRADNWLRADLHVLMGDREFNTVQLVDRDGKPLNCPLDIKRDLMVNTVYTYMVFPGAYNPTSISDESPSVQVSTGSSIPAATATPSFSLEDGSNSISDSLDAATLLEDTVSNKDHRGEAAPASLENQSGNVSFSDPATDNAPLMPNIHVEEEVAENVTKLGPRVTRSVTSLYGLAARSKRREDSLAPTDHKDCVASKTEKGVVTWLVQFKKYENLLTGNDVTVEVTCRLQEADSLEPQDTVADGSEREEPMKGVVARVQTSAFLADAYSGDRQEHFHLGQTLRLIVRIRGLLGGECAYPYNCSVSVKGGKEYILLDKNGCGEEGSPVREMYTDGRGIFTSNSFPAFSLGAEVLQLRCRTALYWREGYECSTRC